MNHEMTIPLDDQDGLACRLWKKCSREYTFALYTPFMVCLAAGNLEEKTYQYYLFQDIDYGETCIQVAENARNITNDADAKDVFDRFKKGWEKELKRLTDYLEHGTEYRINPATNSYKQHLLETVSGKIEGQIFEGAKVAVFTLGAMMPCWRLYASLGQKIVESLGGEVDQNNPYKDWIESNAKESLEESTRKVEALLNKLCEPLTVEELEIIEKLYCKSMKHEIEFFLAPPTLDQPTVLPLKRVAFPENVRLLLLSGILADNGIVTASSNLPDLREVQSTGDINKSLEPAVKKIQTYKDILKKRKDDKVNLTVYIGSSLGDLLCLLQANIGIVIEPSSSLLGVGSQLGVSFQPLFPSLLMKQKAISAASTADWKELSGVIYTVNSWAEIDAFISGWKMNEEK